MTDLYLQIIKYEVSLVNDGLKCNIVFQFENVTVEMERRL